MPDLSAKGVNSVGALAWLILQDLKLMVPLARAFG